MPTILNLHHTRGTLPLGCIRIDRQTMWGNPFVIGQQGWTRDDVLRLHRKYMGDMLPRWRDGMPTLLDHLHELEGRDLACWCHPWPCHGNFLMALANTTSYRRVVMLEKAWKEAA